MYVNDNFLHGTHVKDTLSALKEEYQYLGPAHGAALISSHYLFNIYHFGLTTHSTTLLVREMFHCSDLNDSLKDTRNKSKPAYFLSASRIALIASCLENKVLQDPGCQNRIIEPWYRESRCSKTTLQRFLTLIIESDAEWRKGLYFPHATVTILLAFLWKRALGKEEIKDFLMELDEGFPETILREEEFASLDAIKQWSQSEFQGEELNSVSLPAYCSTLSTTETPSSLQKIDRCIELLIAHKFFIHIGQCPPKVPGKNYGYKGQRPAPDCCEVTIRNVINMVLFDPVRNCFAMERLEEMNAIKGLKRFYSKQEPTLQSTRSAKSGQKWMNLMSNLEEVKYLSGEMCPERPPYEIKPGSRNLRRVFNALFQGNAPDWKEIGDLLSTKDCRVHVQKVDGKNVKFTFVRGGFEVGPFFLYSGSYHASFRQDTTALHKQKDAKAEEASFPLVQNVWRRCLRESCANEGVSFAPLMSLLVEGRRDVLRKRVRKKILRDKTLTFKWIYHLLLSLPRCKATRRLARQAKKRFPELKEYYQSLKQEE